MRRFPAGILGATLLLAALAAPISAQAPRIDGPRSSRLTPAVAAEPSTLRASMMRSVRPNHWKRGALIGGGIVTVLFMVAVALDDCTGGQCDGTALAYAPGVFLLGALPGSFIGSFFPRDTL
ncbi:MAG: hypothetical protein U0974_10220 [Gemmatimonadales bacterium]|nr:hypothetical protein [Gemmatimonadales bacterium]MDZ4390092.1 hypothetical protein [Gemmatimonadales bacterium]